MQSFIRETFHALRSMRRTPSFFVTIVGIVALTVGANSLIFGLVRGVLLSPLPYAQPERLVVIWEENTQKGYLHNTVSLPNFEDWQREARSFEALAAWRQEEDVISGQGEPTRLVGGMVTNGFFAVLGVRPRIGRVFSAAEENGKAPVVLISEELWRSRFSGSREVLGKSLLLDGNPYQIIGVMPQGFDQPLATLLKQGSFWRPMAVSTRLQSRGTRFLRVLGRASGNPTRSAAELATIARQLGDRYPEDAGWSLSVIPLHEEIVRTVRPVLQILWIAAILVLLVGCTNLANILLARAAGREHEIALRLSLGATRVRLFGLFAAEILILVLPGSLLGALLAWVGGRFLTRNYLQFLPRLEAVDMGRPVLWFTLFLAAVITLLTAALVVMRAAKLDLGKRLVQMGNRAGASRGTRRMRDLLAVLQVVFTFPLLVSTVLLAKSVLRLENVDLGFNPHNVVAAQLALPDSRYKDPQAQAAFFRDLLEKLKSSPEMATRSAVSDLPLSEWDTGVEFSPVGMQTAAGEKTPSGQIRIIAPDYFSTMGIRRARGRDFDERDRKDSEPVLIVNEELVRRFLHGRDPLSERLSVNYFGRTIEGRIVGVVGDVRHGGPADELRPTIYVPFLQLPARRMAILVRSKAGTATVAGILRADIQSLDGNLSSSDLVGLESLYNAAIAAPRLRALVLAILGGLALALAALGIFGVVSYSTAVRRHEIGVRMALGARPGGILLMILRQGALLCLWGVLGGAALELGVSRLLASNLFGVDVLDFGTYLIVAALLILIGVIASLKPASGAIDLAPALVLKGE